MWLVILVSVFIVFIIIDLLNDNKRHKRNYDYQKRINKRLQQQINLLKINRNN